MSNIPKRAAVLVDGTRRPAHLGLRVGATNPLELYTTFGATTARHPWNPDSFPARLAPHLRGFLASTS